jgi:hypothetical protein
MEFLASRLPDAQILWRSCPLSVLLPGQFELVIIVQVEKTPHAVQTQSKGIL